jgi:hypothetical protein
MLIEEERKWLVADFMSEKNEVTFVSFSGGVISVV